MILHKHIAQRRIICRELEKFENKPYDELIVPIIRDKLLSDIGHNSLATMATILGYFQIRERLYIRNRHVRGRSTYRECGRAPKYHFILLEVKIQTGNHRQTDADKFLKQNKVMRILWRAACTEWLLKLQTVKAWLEGLKCKRLS